MYNIPDGGYSYQYHFKESRWLRADKNLDPQGITIINEKATGRDDELFTISFSNIPAGSYTMVFEFKQLPSGEVFATK